MQGSHHHKGTKNTKRSRVIPFVFFVPSWWNFFILPDSSFILGMLDVGMLAVRVLAVVGAVAVGGLGTGWLVKGLAKGFAFKSAPAPLLRISRVLGGLILGLVVAAWVFNLGGTGGIGGSGGGWWPFGQGSGSGTGIAPGSGGAEISPQPKLDPNAQTFRIHMRGGNEAQKDQRFYVIEGESPLTWMELEKVLAEKRKDNQPLVIGIVIGRKSVDEQSPAVRILKNWAQENSVAVKMEIES
jgi:hypothetical protein